MLDDLAFLIVADGGKQCISNRAVCIRGAVNNKIPDADSAKCFDRLTLGIQFAKR